jgi:protein SCO1
MRSWLGRAVFAAVLTGLSAGLSAGISAGGAAAAAPPPLPFEKLFGGSFTLVDQDGKTRTDRDFRGRFLLIYFGYTYCPSICPTNLAHMADALTRLGPAAERVQPVFITIDPMRDTPAQIRAYAESFGDRFIGLTGSEAQIRDVARKYRVHRRKVQDPDAAPGANDTYLVDHSSITHLVGPDGKFVTLFPHDTTGDVMAQRMEKYLAAQKAASR